MKTCTIHDNDLRQGCSGCDRVISHRAYALLTLLTDEIMANADDSVDTRARGAIVGSAVIALVVDIATNMPGWGDGNMVCAILDGIARHTNTDPMVVLGQTTTVFVATQAAEGNPRAINVAREAVKLDGSRKKK